MWRIGKKYNWNRKQAVLSGMLAAACLCISIFDAEEANAVRGKNDFCIQTAELARQACLKDCQDNYFTAQAICLNLSDAGEREHCRSEAKDTKEEQRSECSDQFRARKDVCSLVGEGRYDPDFNPANFVNPADIGTTVAPNPYFPLVRGTRWVYNSATEVDTVEVTAKTKNINGVTCGVVRDVVTVNGVATEITDDWIAQDKTGNVWYCGEITQQFETFAGDSPAEAELVGIEGAWKAGRDGAKPGILMLAAPRRGIAYREEMEFGNAEDVAEVMSVTGTASVPAASCSGNCVVTRNFTALHPGENEYKYYAAGIGAILEVDADGGKVQLVEFHAP